MTVVYGAVNLATLGADSGAFDGNYLSRPHRTSQHPRTAQHPPSGGQPSSQHPRTAQYPPSGGQPSQRGNNRRGNNRNLREQIIGLEGLFNNLYNQHGALDMRVEELGHLLTTLLPRPVENPETVTYNPAAPPPPPYTGGPGAERPPTGASQRGTPVHRVNGPRSTGPQGQLRPVTPGHLRRNPTNPSPHNLSREASPQIAQPVPAQHLTAAQLAAIEQHLQSGPQGSGMSSPTGSVTSARSVQPVSSPPGLGRSRFSPNNGGRGVGHPRQHSNPSGPPSRLGTPHHPAGLASSRHNPANST